MQRFSHFFFHELIFNLQLIRWFWKNWVLYFGVKKQNQRNHLINFQNIPHKNVYTSACLCSICWNTSASLIEVSPKHAFWKQWKQQPLLQVLKSVDLPVCTRIFLSLKLYVTLRHPVFWIQDKLNEKFITFQCSKYLQQFPVALSE